MSYTTTSCPQSAIGVHDPDARGDCRWCSAHVDRPAPMPQRLPVSDLTEAYRYRYDPDFDGEVAR